MKEFCNMKYYTLNLIPAYRQEFLSLKLKWLVELLGLKDSHWPLDCMEILKSLEASQLIPFIYGFTELPQSLDALAKYEPDYDIYLIHINKSKVNYPYECSNHRRLNLTLAHELAHIALDHVLIPRELKTKEKLDLEEAEANELAGRLVMPERLIFSCNFYSLASAAEYFMVSKTALWKRLNNMKRLDLLHSRSVRTCENCGNTSFSVFSEYCGICGKPIANKLKGIQRIYYDSGIKMDNYKRVFECPLCKSKHFNYDRCSRCNTYIFNFCSDHTTNQESGCEFVNVSSSRFCEMCGKPTYFFKRGLLEPWENAAKERKTYIGATR